MKFTDIECNLLINGIFEWRNMLLEQGLPTEDVDTRSSSKSSTMRRENEMERFIIDERNGWEYELKGEQYYPTGRVIKNGDMTPDIVPEYNEPEKEIPIGIWGKRHSVFLKKHQRRVYNELFCSGKLNAYLTQIDCDAQEMFDLLIRQLTEQEGATEQLKAKDQMVWVQKMNSIQTRATEIVNNELIFA